MANPINPDMNPSMVPTLRRRGIAMVLFAATCWGLSGTASQILFQDNHLQVAWLVAIRMLISGIVLVVWGMLRNNPASRTLIMTPKHWPRLAVYAVAGLVSAQFTYLKAIADGNAASATLLLYLAPPAIVAYSALRARAWPSRASLAAMSLAVLGTVLLVTGGDMQQLAVPLPAVVWGLLSALGLVFNTLFPVPLVQRYDALAVVGWGMLIGGVSLIAIGPTWRLSLAHWTVSGFVLIAFVVLLGTLAAFSLYLSSLRYLTPSETGLFATAEPVAAVLASMMFLHVHLDHTALMGALSILAAIIWLTRTPNSLPPIKK